MRIILLCLLCFNITACSTVRSIITEPVEKPKLNLPEADPISMKPVSFVVLTPENTEEVFKKLEQAKEELVLFGMKGQSYKNLSLNLEILKQHMRFQNEVIRLYKQYYEDNQKQN
jgi:hypothetical protein